MKPWTARDIPDQHGRTIIITGASSGVGMIAAIELARAGAHVIAAVRDVSKGHRALSNTPGNLEIRRLDLSSLASTRAFVGTIRNEALPGIVWVGVDVGSSSGGQVVT